jgi:1-acyl-sn-glycerol-3-phosphate acyltransferase
MVVATLPCVMAFDGFVSEEKDAFVGFSAAVSERFFRAIDVLGRKLGVEVQGIDRLPDGGALLVANHTFGWDVAFAIARIHARTGRTIWALGEHLWWRVPVVRRLASAVGVVDGTHENADSLLSRGEIVLVLPGGLREAIKPRALRYRLLWGHRYGFVRVALRNKVPLVPLACVGLDDLRDHLHPRKAKLRFVIGEPIPVDDRTEDDLTVRRIRREVEGALHELIETELARRVGICA